MRFLVSEKLGPHKFKTPEGYLICTDAILSRTGKQEYKRCELFGDACEDPDELVQVDRTNDEVFSDKAMASFENKAICVEHPDVDVNAENHNDLSVGFVRDIHKGEYEGEPVMMGTLVITDKAAIDAVESGEYEELSCGYDCDVEDTKNPQQKNIRGNHVALCKQGRAGIARIIDSVDDVKATTKPGTDKIIYVMQSDIDKNLYFYIGKTFAMKEGAFGYTKFEMDNTTPEQLKAELAKNGWHQVANGPARVIDTNDERPIKRAELKVGMNIRWKHHGEQYEGRIKHVEQNGSYTKVDYEDKRGVGASFAFENESISIADEYSWSKTEEENYKKANNIEVGKKDATEKTYHIYVKNVFGAYKVADWPAVSKEAAVKEFLESNPAYRNKGIIEARDSVKKDSLYTVEFEKDGETFVRKVRAASVEDAIAKAKDGRRLNYDDDIIRVKLNGREVYKGIAEDWIDDSFYDNFKWTGSYYEATNKQGKWVVEVI